VAEYARRSVPGTSVPASNYLGAKHDKREPGMAGSAS
jgi:hypothetical protein